MKRVKNLLFDLTSSQPTQKIKYHGGSEYSLVVFKKLAESESGNVLGLHDPKSPLSSDFLKIIEDYSVKLCEYRSKQDIERIIAENKIGRFYSPIPSNALLDVLSLKKMETETVVTIHGLRFLETPTDRFEWKYADSYRSRLKTLYKRISGKAYKNKLLDALRGVLKADLIITVSEHSRYSLLNFFPELEQNKIKVFYSPLNDYKNEIYQSVFADKPAVIPGKYFLVLSGSIWIKNSYRAVKAFDELVSDGQIPDDYKMLVSGMGKLKFHVRNPGSFVFTDYLPRPDLEFCLKNAFALVYPTLNEGFGYPSLEALKYGVPVIISGTGPLPEVNGDVALYFNPNSIEEIKIRLLQALTTPDINSQEIVNKRKERYQWIQKRQNEDLDQLAALLLK